MTEQLMLGPSEVELGRHLRELRLALTLEVEQLAGRSGLQVDVIRALELGRHEADLRTLSQFARGLGMRLGVIFALCERGLLARASDS